MLHVLGLGYLRLMSSSLILLATQAKAMSDPLPCRRENPELWFSELPIDLELAKTYCRQCPIRRFCLAGAVERREPHGVWGGEIFTHGRIISEKRPRGRPPGRRAGVAERI
jgi:WhiB family redox-sensing transcriptional regulator